MTKDTPMPYNGPERRENSGAISLEHHLDALLLGIEKRIDIKLEAMEKAIVLRAGQLDRELEHLNQVRSEVLTDRANFVSREAWDASRSTHATWRETVEKRITQIETRAITWGAAFAVGVVVLNIALRMLGVGK